MSVRVDNAADAVTGGGTLPAAAGPYTIAGWFYIVADTGAPAPQGLMSLATVASSDITGMVWEDLATDGSAALTSYDDGSATLNSALFASRPATGTWFFAALVVSGSGANQVAGFWSAVDSDTFVTQTITLVAGLSAPTSVDILNDIFGAFSSGRAELVGLWDRALTENELRTQKWSNRPVNPLSINRFWPLSAAGDTRDISGNARSPTLTSVATEASPPVGDILVPNWGYYIAAAAGNITLDADTGTITVTGQTATVSTAMAAAQGTVTATGQAATMAWGMAAAQGTVTVTGQAATVSLLMAAAQGAVTVTGQDGSFTLRMAGAQGTVTVTGFDADFSVPGALVLNADTGTLTVTGQNATVRISVAAAQGSLSVSGQAAAFLMAMFASVGTITVTGQEAELEGGAVAVPPSTAWVNIEVTLYPGSIWDAGASIWDGGDDVYDNDGAIWDAGSSFSSQSNPASNWTAVARPTSSWTVTYQ